MAVSANAQKTMKRVVVDHFGGPEVLRVVEDDIPRPGPGEVRVRVLAAGVSFTDAQLRAGTYLGVPKPAVSRTCVTVAPPTPCSPTNESPPMMRPL